jgi:dihydropyrimidinase
MIENGKIKDLSKSLNNINYSKSIDATGNYILPGLIDPHVHYGVYTPIEKAARTDTKSAAIGVLQVKKNIKISKIKKVLNTIVY